MQGAIDHGVSVIEPPEIEIELVTHVVEQADVARVEFQRLLVVDLGFLPEVETALDDTEVLVDERIVRQAFQGFLVGGKRGREIALHTITIRAHRNP